MSESSESFKRGRAAVSPITEEEGKRQCLDLDSSYTQAFDGTTIIESNESNDPLHSTVIEVSPVGPSTMDTGAVKEGLREALTDPAILRLLTEAVVAPLMAQIKFLRETVAQKDREIGDLTARVDSLEQYSRRNSVRISGIKVKENESTDEIVKKLSAEIGVKVTDEMIDRSHRVGRPDQQERAILVKFTSYRHKRSLMAARRLLKKKTATSLGFSPSRPRSAAEAVSGPANGIFINDDLTSQRARLAARARRLKGEKRIQDTWVWDGDIFVKKNDSVTRITTDSELDKFQ